jgi:hypothetical protein
MQIARRTIGPGHESLELDISPYSLFVGSIRSPVTREKYLQRMGYFFDFLNIDGNGVKGHFEKLTLQAKSDVNWFANIIFMYLQMHKDRVERREISSATLRNYVKPIKVP